MAQQVDLIAVRDLLVEAIAMEHRLYQAAVEARADAERWSARATLAHRKEAMDLAAAANKRAAACWARARAYATQYLQEAAHVAQLKTLVAGSRVSGGGPAVARVRADDGFDATNRTLPHTTQSSRRRDQGTDLDAELAELKRRFGRT